MENELHNEVKNENGRSLNAIAILWQKLTTPVSGLSDNDAYYAHITMTLTLLFVPFVTIQVLVQLLNGLGSVFNVLSLIFYWGLTFALYLLSRTKYYIVTSVALCVVTAVYPYARIFVRTDFSDGFVTYSLSWLILSIILATVLLTFKQAVLFTGLVILSIFGFVQIVPEISTIVLIRSVAIVAVSAVLLILFFYYRTRIDRQRLIQLAQANAELQKSKTEQAKLYLQASQNEATLELIFEKAPIGMMVNDEGGRLIRANQAFCELVGYSEEELRVKPYTEFTHPDDVTMNATYSQQLQAGEIEQFQMEKRYIHRNGDVITVFLQVARLEPDAQGNRREVAQVVNITRRKKTEKALLAQKRLLQDIIDNNSSIIYVKDKNGRYIMANKPFYAFFNASSQTLLNKTDHMLFPKETADALVKNDQIVLASGSAMQFEEIFNQADGLHTYLSVKFPLFEQTGEPYAVAGISTDITDRKQNEEALLRSTKQLQTIRQMGLELVSQLDIDPLVQMILTRAAQLVDGDLGGIYIHLPATQELEVIVTNDEQRLPTGARIADDAGVAGHVWKTGEAIIIENYSEWAGRAPGWDHVLGSSSVIGAPIKWQEQKQGVINISSPRGSFFTQEDVELLSLFAANAAFALYNAKLHKELQKHTQELERSNRELQSFAYAASHDLQEPLRKIRTFSDRLQTRFKDQLDERGQSYLTRMETAAARMQTLIEGLLSFSRVTTQTNAYKLINIRTVLQEALEDLETKIEESQADIIIADQLPVIEADPTQIRQLFQNLIGNALKFHRPNVPPQVYIQARWLPNEENPHFCEIDVCDNGIGIEPEYESRIFGMFQRLHSRQQFDGTGLGLAICQRIVERHHGTILVQSQLGEGTRFTIQLPLKQPD